MFFLIHQKNKLCLGRQYSIVRESLSRKDVHLGGNGVVSVASWIKGQGASSLQVGIQRSVQNRKDKTWSRNYNLQVGKGVESEHSTLEKKEGMKK